MQKFGLGLGTHAVTDPIRDRDWGVYDYNSMENNEGTYSVDFLTAAAVVKVDRSFFLRT